jgi:hypothetical protein
MGRKITYARLLAGLAALACALGGCGGSSITPATSPNSQRAALATYLRQIEPLRLAVNRLLGRADPILSGYHDRRLSSTQASGRMGALERRFADYAVDIAAITPATSALRQLHDV